MVETKLNIENLKKIAEALGYSPASRKYSPIEKFNARAFLVFRATPNEKNWLANEKETNWMVMAPGMQEFAAAFREAVRYSKTVILPMSSLEESLAAKTNGGLSDAVRLRYSRKLAELSELVRDPVAESYLAAASKSLEYKNVPMALNSLNAALSKITKT